MFTQKIQSQIHLAKLKNKKTDDIPMVYSLFGLLSIRLIVHYCVDLEAKDKPLYLINDFKRSLEHLGD